MKLYEMEGFLRGNGLPCDMKVNETNAEYLVRKFSEADSEITHLKKKLSVINSLMDAAEQASKLAQEATEKLVQERNALAAENAGLKASIPQQRNVEFDNDSMDDISLAEDVGFNDAIGRMKINMSKTPATDAFLAEVRASALEYYANLFKDTVNMDLKHNQEFHKGTLYVADQFRKGVQS